MFEIDFIVNSFFNSVTYLIKVGKYLYLVDCGDIEPIIEYIEKNKLTLKAVFLTHSHYDHIYGINELCNKYPTCIVYTSEYGAIALKDSKKNLSLYNGFPMEFWGDKVVALNDGEIVELYDNIKFKVLSTPGHCPSCLSYYTDSLIFTGDSYIPNIKVVTKLPKGDKLQAEISVEKIISLIEKRQVYPGHK